jgi:dihydrofolate reductase
MVPRTKADGERIFSDQLPAVELACGQDDPERGSKFVVTQRIVDASWTNTTVISGPVSDGVLQAQTAADGDLVCFGGAGFVNALLRHDLVDELQLYINPGVAGDGSRIFDRTMATENYQLVETISTTCGILIGRWTKWRQSQDAEGGNATWKARSHASVGGLEYCHSA